MQTVSCRLSGLISTEINANQDQTLNPYTEGRLGTVVEWIYTFEKQKKFKFKSCDSLS